MPTRITHLDLSRVTPEIVEFACNADAYVRGYDHEGKHHDFQTRTLVQVEWFEGSVPDDLNPFVEVLGL